RFGEFRMVALIGFSDRLWHAVGVVGVNVEHDEKLSEKLCAVAFGETGINLPGQCPLFGRIRGQQLLKKVGFHHKYSPFMRSDSLLRRALRWPARQWAVRSWA